MLTDSKDYSLFHKFIDTYQPSGFKGIDPGSSLMRELENMMEANNQFFYIADLIKIQILYTSKRSIHMIGIEPEELSPYHFMEATHPDDIKRLILGRSKIIRMAQELFLDESGDTLLSTNYKVRNLHGGYADLLMQCYIFYTTLPYKTVFFLKIHTNIDWYKKIKHGYHYYVGKDLSYFRYPDDEMLMRGNIFSGREFEIIRLIESGLDTDEIAEKLYLSPHTISTHRRNILEKTGKAHISDVIYNLKERGIL